MFDIGWSEMAVIAFIALIVIGPKELPNAMRAAAKWARKARSLAREFQSGVDDMIREADLEDARKAVDATRDFDIGKTIEDTVDPTGSVRKEVEDLEAEARREPAEETSTDKGAGAEEDLEGAAVIEHPVNIAPPHSLNPPPEEKSAETPPAAGDDDTKKRARGP